MYLQVYIGGQTTGTSSQSSANKFAFAADVHINQVCSFEIKLH